MNKIKKYLLKYFIGILLVLSLAGCSNVKSMSSSAETSIENTVSTTVSDASSATDVYSNSSPATVSDSFSTLSDAPSQTTEKHEAQTDSINDKSSAAVSSKADLSSIPEYSSDAYISLNNNEPFFTSDEISNAKKGVFESYSNLDSLGRCGIAISCLGKETMPSLARGEIGSIRPSGWHTVKYNGIDGNYLYNRCHLIGYQLSGENANDKNLITGTRYLNIEGMLPFENETADYIESTGNHVLYRVIPLFRGNNLVADGVTMEAESIEDNGSGLKFCVFCYNVQPGITIDYSTGDSTGPEFTGSQSNPSVENHTNAAYNETNAGDNADSKTTDTKNETTASADTDTDFSSNSVSYILNTKSRKFHNPGCPAAKKISDENKEIFSGSRDDLIKNGYSPCGICNP